MTRDLLTKDDIPHRVFWPKTTGHRRERLLMMLRHPETVPIILDPDTDFIWDYGTVLETTECGSKGCALGLMYLDPVMKLHEKSTDIMPLHKEVALAAEDLGIDHSSAEKAFLYSRGTIASFNEHGGREIVNPEDVAEELDRIFDLFPLEPDDA